MVPLCLKPPAIKFNTHTHTHTGTYSTVQWSSLFSAVASLWKPPPLPLPNTHRRHHHFHSRPLLSAPLGCEETIPQHDRKEWNCRGGCRGNQEKKKKTNPFYRLERVCHSSSYPALRCVGNTVEPSRRRGAFPRRTAKKTATMSHSFSSKRGVNTARNAFSADHQRRAQRDHSVSTVISSLSYLSLTPQPGLLWDIAPPPLPQHTHTPTHTSLQ